MSTATARAEARRKAILGRGSDRLSRLTNSARGGEDTLHLTSAEQPVSNKQSVASLIGDDLRDPPLSHHRSAQFDIGTTTVLKPKTMLQKLLPLVHILFVWLLFAFFVLFQEPGTFATNVRWQSGSETSLWQRWAELGAEMDGITFHQSQPFMWAFTTLELVLFSFRVFSGFDPIAQPTILTAILPMLPPQLSSISLNGLRYLQIFGTLLDDLAAVLIAIGFVVFVCGWVDSSGKTTFAFLKLL